MFTFFPLYSDCFHTNHHHVCFFGGVSTTWICTSRPFSFSLSFSLTGATASLFCASRGIAVVVVVEVVAKCLAEGVDERVDVLLLVLGVRLDVAAAHLDPRVACQPPLAEVALVQVRVGRGRVPAATGGVQQRRPQGRGVGGATTTVIRGGTRPSTTSDAYNATSSDGANSNSDSTDSTDSYTSSHWL